MTDLLHVVPNLDVSKYSHILPSLERARIGSNDLLTLDALDVARRAQVPLAEVRRLADELLNGLHLQLDDQRRPASVEDAADHEIDYAPAHDFASISRISTLDQGLDGALGGGFPAGRLSEITGERYGIASRTPHTASTNVAISVRLARLSSCSPSAWLYNYPLRMDSSNPPSISPPKHPYKRHVSPRS